MDKTQKIFVFGILIVLVSLSFLSAQTCDKIISSTNLQDFGNEISSINFKLSSCNSTLPKSVSTLVGDGTTQINILTSQGTANFFLEIKSGKIISLSQNTSNKISYIVTLDESSMNSILSSSDRAGEIASLYSQGKIKIQGNTFWNKLKLAFAKPFINKFLNQNQAPISENTKPENCDETYLPGHRDYAKNKELWDSYSADSKGVCQSQFGKGIPSPCVYSVQLSIEGNPYYLCWYN